MASPRQEGTRHTQAHYKRVRFLWGEWNFRIFSRFGNSIHRAAPSGCWSEYAGNEGEGKYLIVRLKQRYTENEMTARRLGVFLRIRNPEIATDFLIWQNIRDAK